MLDTTSTERTLILPPPYNAHGLAIGDPFVEAQRLATEHGAGCLTWHYNTANDQRGRLDFAVVLEPETPLADARRAFIVGMVAIGDALAALCPPERSVTYRWPSEIMLDTGRLGGMRFAAASKTGEGDVPDWMVLGVEMIADRDHLPMPGNFPGSISLKEEEFTDPPALVEKFAAYLMLNFDRWNHEGFDAVASRYNERLSSEGKVTETGDLARGDDLLLLKDSLTQTLWRDANGPML